MHLIQGNTTMGWLFVWVVFITWAVMQWKKKLPSTQSVQDFFAALNSKGANIVTLGSMAIFFFVTGMKFIYWVTERINEGKLTTDNAIISQGFNWISGAAFGMVLSAMLKAMTGDSGRARSSDLLNTSGVTGTVTSTTKVETTSPQATPQDVP